MKGVITAGGLGTRLHPLTKITNKHLLPVYDRPMIYYPVEKLAQAGITDILIIAGGNNAGDFLRLLGNGREFGLKRLRYTYQEGETGIAAALLLAEDFAENDRMTVILGDNIFEDNLKPFIQAFEHQERGARILIKEVPNPQEYGVVEIEAGKVKGIEEKPEKPKSKYAQTGIYMYDSGVFSIIKTLKPSDRGELEITDVNNVYLRKELLKYDILKGWWIDAGESIESYFRATEVVRNRKLEK